MAPGSSAALGCVRASSATIGTRSFVTVPSQYLRRSSASELPPYAAAVMCTRGPRVEGEAPFGGRAVPRKRVEGKAPFGARAVPLLVIVPSTPLAVASVHERPLQRPEGEASAGIGNLGGIPTAVNYKLQGD